ncbi:MAG TPA: VanW family protein [Acidimicrobiales bacterium]|nr:VanW family protein [Acidimicrobiales bacterium]
MPRARFYVLVALGGLVLVPVLIVVAYLVDDGGRGDYVASNVSLVGTALDGLKGKALDAKVAKVAGRLEQARIVVKAPKGGFTTSAGEVKLTVDRRATARAALEVGRTGNVVSRSWHWLTAFVRDRQAPLQSHASGDAVYQVVADKDKVPHKAAVEPTLKLDKGRFVAVAGKDGTGIDPAELVRALDHAASAGRSAMTVSVDRGEVKPRLTLAEARRLAGDANKLSTQTLPVASGRASADVPTKTLQSWIKPAKSDTGPHLTVDPKQTLSDLADLLPNAGEPSVETRFSVSGGTVLIIDGHNGTGCCDDAAIDMLNDALRRRPSGRLRLPMKVVEPRLTPEAARKLGIVERVATFTTKHPAGQPRVKNIHLIADTVQGSVIRPGNSFSINGTVGQRTLAKGYVVDHVIEDSVFAESVGGGISQFATTLFNAAFFGGLELKTYQSHTLYISRYPYGREATMGWPSPDLVLRNPSPYGILIWPSYDGTSITVDLYSTKWVEATQSGQTLTPSGQCTMVKTDRTRKFLSDGHTSVDSVYAKYFPKEGVNCDGSISPKLTTTTTKPTTTTTTKPTTTTTPGPGTTTTATTAPP